jgi:hypothetical protein
VFNSDYVLEMESRHVGQIMFCLLYFKYFRIQRHKFSYSNLKFIDFQKCAFFLLFLNKFKNYVKLSNLETGSSAFRTTQLCPLFIHNDVISLLKIKYIPFTMFHTPQINKWLPRHRTPHARYFYIRYYIHECYQFVFGKHSWWFHLTWWQCF